MTKKILYTSLLMLLVLTTMTGCLFEKRNDLKVKEDNITVNFKILDKIKYTLSRELKDFKSSRECAMIITKDFKIGVEINKDMSYEKYKGSFEKLKKARSESTEYKEVTYSGIKGFQRYNESYMRYEVYLPIKDNDEQCLQLNIYSTKNRDEATREQYKSEEVQDILNHIKIKYEKESTKKTETKKETKKESKTETKDKETTNTETTNETTTEQ